MSGLDSGNYGLMFIVFQAAIDLGAAWTPERWAVTGWVAQLLFLGLATLAALSSRRPSTTVAGAALYLGHTLSYFQVWEHHLSGVIPVGLALLWGLEDLAVRWWAKATALGAVVCLALPTPFRLFDRALNVRSWDPSGDWPHYAHYLMPLCKAGPVLVLYAVALLALVRPLLPRGVHDLANEQQAAGDGIA